MRKLVTVVMGMVRRLAGYLMYRNVSIQKKIIFSYLMLLLIPIFICSIFFDAFVDSARQKEIQRIEQLNYQAADTMNSYVNDLMQLTRQPLYNTEIMTGLRALFYRKDGDEEAQGVSGEGAGGGEYTNLVNSIIAYKPYIRSVFLLDTEGNSLAYSLNIGQLAEAYDPGNEQWFIRALALKGTAHLFSVHNIPDILPKEPANKRERFVVARAIKDYNSVDILGVLAIFSDIGGLREICSGMRTVPGEKIFVADSSDMILYSLDESHIGKPLKDNIPVKDIGYAAGTDTQKRLMFDGSRHLWMEVHASVPDWRLIRIVPEDALYSDQKKVQRGLVLTAAGLAFLCLLMAFSMSIGITRPIKKLTSMMKVVENGDLSVRFKAKYRDEIGQLGRVFNSMLGKIDALVRDVYISDIRKKEAELTALQTQINPHFIYNTLESIRMTARLNKDLPAANMASILGKLLRYSINTKNQSVTVKEEIEHLQNYMVLQNSRFDDKFLLKLDNMEPFYDLNIIKLIFQPIVENSIYHALEQVDRKGIITLSSWETDEDICFKVEDNGVGMTEEETEKLIFQINDFSTEGKNTRGIGLRNVNERIKLYYGKDYGLDISSSPGKGTAIMFRFPSRTQMERLKQTGFNRIVPGGGADA